MGRGGGGEGTSSSSTGSPPGWSCSSWLMSRKSCSMSGTHAMGVCNLSMVLQTVIDSPRSVASCSSPISRGKAAMPSTSFSPNFSSGVTSSSTTCFSANRSVTFPCGCSTYNGGGIQRWGRNRFRQVQDGALQGARQCKALGPGPTP